MSFWYSLKHLPILQTGNCFVLLLLFEIFSADFKGGMCSEMVRTGFTNLVFRSFTSLQRFLDFFTETLLKINHNHDYAILHRIHTTFLGISSYL
jgi:hypothetical protein